jgi:hypothetical protein
MTKAAFSELLRIHQILRVSIIPLFLYNRAEMGSGAEGFEFFLFRKNMGKYLRARREEEKGGS